MNFSFPAGNDTSRNGKCSPSRLTIAGFYSFSDHDKKKNEIKTNGMKRRKTETKRDKQKALKYINRKKCTKSIYKRFLCKTEEPDSSYSFLEIRNSGKVENEAKVEAPANTPYRASRETKDRIDAYGAS